MPQVITRLQDIPDLQTLTPAANKGYVRNSGNTAWELRTFGTLATQDGTFSGTSSGTNTGDVANTALTTGKLSQFAATTSAELAGVISDETGTGPLVFAIAPAFITRITTPTVVGGTGTTSTLTYQTTTGVGATGARHIFLVGNNGATEAMTILNSGFVGIGTASPSTKLHVVSTATTNPARIDIADATTSSLGNSGSVLTLYNTDTTDGNFVKVGLNCLDTGATARNAAVFGAQVTARTGSTVTADFIFSVANAAVPAEVMRLKSNGNAGIGQASPTAVLHLKAGTATASTAPLKQTSGTKLTTAEAYVAENDDAGSNKNWLLTNAAIRFAVGGSIFDHYTGTSSTSTDGTENNLYSDTLAANTFNTNGDTVTQAEHVSFVSSATATRRVRRYFAGTQVFDSGTLTLTLGGDFLIQTLVIRESSTVATVVVSVTTTSASTVPYVTKTRITGLTLSATNILKTTGVAAGTGAASADIVDNISKTTFAAAA